MLSLILWSVVLAAVAGVGVKLILDRLETPAEVTWKEFGIGMAIICFILVPASSYIGWEVARGNLVEFNEYWNGWEVRVVKEDIVCTKDGSCYYEYDCDPYLVPVTYSCNCDSKGNCSTCVRLETHYHSCPYVDVESHYSIETTLGAYDVDSHRLPDDPQAHRWDKSERVPQWVIDKAGVGAPPFWLAAKNRIETGDPGPATKRMTYKNYILASDRTILKAYSAEIEKYEKAGLLPKLTHDIHTFYLADKAYFVGYTPPDAKAWQLGLGKLNAGLGTELQGDLHLVIVQHEQVNANPDAYALALKPYWQNTQVFDRDALPKNAIVVIVGTADSQTVTWARAFTGMPIGNEEMLLAIQNRLKGAALTPDSVIGMIRGQIDWNNGNKPKVQSSHTGGVLATVLWGLDNPEFRFRRYSMQAKDPGDIGGGYLYLMGEIQPTGSQKFWIGFVCFIICCLVWVACSLIGERQNLHSFASIRAQFGYHTRRR